jgi:hypothetical protein
MRWIPVRNDAGAEIPGFGVMRPTGAVTVHNQVVITVAKPNADSATGQMINGPNPIPTGLYGQGTWDLPAYALYNTGATPAYGEDWGTENAEWKLKSGNTGFRIVGGATSGRVLVGPQPNSAAITPVFAFAGDTGGDSFTTSATKLGLNTGTAQGMTYSAADDRVTVDEDGRYWLWAVAAFSCTGLGNRVTFTIYKNGSTASRNYGIDSHVANLHLPNVTTLDDEAVAGDYYELYAQGSAGTWTCHGKDLMVYKLPGST